MQAGTDMAEVEKPLPDDDGTPAPLDEPSCPLNRSCAECFARRRCPASGIGKPWKLDAALAETLPAAESAMSAAQTITPA